VWIHRSEFRNWLLAVTSILDTLDDEEAGRVHDIVMRPLFLEGLALCQDNKWEEELEHIEENMNEYIIEDPLGPVC